MVVKLLREALPRMCGTTRWVWPRWQQLLPHVLTAVDPDRPRDDVPDELDWLLNVAAFYRLTRGEAHAAPPLFQRAYTTRRARLGDDQPNTLDSANHLAVGLADLGEHEQARALGEDTLARRRVLGDDHPDTIWSAISLAQELAELGEHEKAHALAENTLAGSRRILDADNPVARKSAEIVQLVDRSGPARA